MAIEELTYYAVSCDECKAMFDEGDADPIGSWLYEEADCPRLRAQAKGWSTEAGRDLCDHCNGTTPRPRPGPVVAVTSAGVKLWGPDDVMVWSPSFTTQDHA